MSLLEHLDRLNNYDSTKDVEKLEPCAHPFQPGIPLLTVEQYLIEIIDSNTDNARRAFNLSTGETLSVQLYDHETFHLKAHLLLADVPGVCGVCDVKSSSEGVAVFTQHTYGDLHGYLRDKKRLSEYEAAPLFQQIVTMVAHAHQQRIALRDIKLKKFVFTNENR